MDRVVEWIVVGAGPAGIASVGKLLDAGVEPSEIIWIDPHFKVGDFGTLWKNVGSNTPVESFLKYYSHAKAFQYHASPTKFMIDAIAPAKNCPLSIAAQPLYAITDLLCKKVTPLKGIVSAIVTFNHNWQLILTDGQKLSARKVILAIGCDAKQMYFEHLSAEVIPLAVALNPSKLKQAIYPSDRVAVFGSAQSAKSVLQNLSTIPTEKSILFYRTENTLLRHFDDFEWSTIVSLEMTPANLLREMPRCTKIISAIGFQRRNIPIEGLPLDYGYDTKTGEIAPGLFGVGMAFPEIRLYELGKEKYPVSAIYPFIKRIDRLMQGWLN